MAWLEHRLALPNSSNDEEVKFNIKERNGRVLCVKTRNRDAREKAQEGEKTLYGFNNKRSGDTNVVSGVNRRQSHK